jgi:hypothetical protein
VTAYEIYQQVAAGVVVAVVGYAAVEAIVRRSRWM